MGRVTRVRAAAGLRYAAGRRRSKMPKVMPGPGRGAMLGGVVGRGAPRRRRLWILRRH